MKKLLLILMTATLFLYGCKKEEEKKETYNDNLGGTVWKTPLTYNYEYILKFTDSKNVNYICIWFENEFFNFPYTYMYSDKEKKGNIVGEGDFTIFMNCLTFDGKQYYKQ